VALVFYCSECGKRADEFCDLSHEDCPEQTVIRCGHNIRTMSAKAQLSTLEGLCISRIAMK
jgi:hypothetical protein